MSVAGVPSDAAELYDISILGFLRSIHADSHSDCPHSHSQQQDLHVLLSPNPHWNLLVFVFLVIAIQMGMRKNLKMILISISLMVQDVEHLFKCLLATCVSSENSLFSSWVHLLIG